MPLTACPHLVNKGPLPLRTYSVNVAILLSSFIMSSIKAKFHYAIWSQTGPKLVADLQRAGIWPII